MGCFDCGAVEMECEDYPEHCDYSTGNCVCNDYNGDENACNGTGSATKAHVSLESTEKK